MGLRPSLTLLPTTAETLQPVTGGHKISAGLAGDLGADPLGFRIQTCLKILQATEAEESVWSSCVVSPDGATATYLVVLLQFISRTVVGGTRFVEECRPAGPHQDQRPKQSHKLLHLSQVQLKTSLLTGCCFHVPRYQFIRYHSPAHITSCPGRNYVGQTLPDTLRDCHDSRLNAAC